MDGAGGYASWVTWVVVLVGTAAFWAVVFLAVRALLAGRNVTPSSGADHPLTDPQEPT